MTIKTGTDPSDAPQKHVFGPVTCPVDDPTPLPGADRSLADLKAGMEDSAPNEDVAWSPISE